MLSLRFQVLVFFVILSIQNGEAQNLVFNGDFETYDTCPDNFSQLNRAQGWFTALNSPDYFNCNYYGPSQTTYPHSGTGLVCMYGGLQSIFSTFYYSELIRTKLTASLKANHRYKINFWLGLDVWGLHNDLSAFDFYFYKNALPAIGDQPNNCLPFQPQIIISPQSVPIYQYAEFNYCFTPTSDFDSLIIGPFCTPTSFVNQFTLNYYMFDDFKIYEDTLPLNFQAAPTVFCAGGYVNFTALNYTIISSADWEFPGGNPSQFSGLYPPPIYYSTPGQYDVKFKITTECDADSVLKEKYIQVLDNNISDPILQDTILKCDDDVATITSTAIGKIKWSTNDTTQTIVVKYPGIYSCIVKSLCDTITDSVLVSDIFCACNLYLPNSFTPDNDGINDILKPIGVAAELSFLIFDRWGQLVYQSRDLNTSWDGNYKSKLAPSGVYVYKMQYLDCKQKKISKTGYINLLR